MLTTVAGGPATGRLGRPSPVGDGADSVSTRYQLLDAPARCGPSGPWLCGSNVPRPSDLQRVGYSPEVSAISAYGDRRTDVSAEWMPEARRRDSANLRAATAHERCKV